MTQTERVATLQGLLTPDRQAALIAAMWKEKKSQIDVKLAETLELRNYVFATDTSTTSVAENTGEWNWKNNVHLPKLCEIRDNLLAIYRTTWFPNDFWMKWEAFTLDKNTKDKRDAIEAYMRNKVRASGAESVLSEQLAADWIDYGIAFSEAVWVDDRVKDANGVVQKEGYVGPAASRISPEDIVFDLTATSFEKSPKIIRRTYTIGDIVIWAKKLESTNPEKAKKLMSAVDLRQRGQEYSTEDWNKIQAFNVDGFQSYKSYLDSGFVEILEFRGTLYDPEIDELQEDYSILVLDRKTVVDAGPWESWMRNGGISSSVWRARPGNLWGMGPLDNLVGLQYRIDHLQGAKDDNVDLHIHPLKIITGDPEVVGSGPDGEIRLGEGESIDFKSPDLSHMQLDNEIQYLLQLMEEFAGSPKQSRGFRTPGEKTLGEVSLLESNANRLFLDKAVKFEKELIETTLNNMLEIGRRNLEGSEAVQTFDSAKGVFSMLSVTAKDLDASGLIRPIGARHFGQRNQQLTNLINLSNSNLWPVIQPHISGIEAAGFVNDLLQLQRYGLISQNAQIFEAGGMQRAQMQMEKELAVEEGVDTEGSVEDRIEDELDAR